MNTERLRVFDKEFKEICVLPRDQVHKQGYWHETFHCWFVSRQNDQTFLTLQLRSKKKQDFPDLLDITAAGHLLENESVDDGVREVEEELGVKVRFTKLIPVGIIKDELVLNNFIDREFCHVYLYLSSLEADEYTLQEEEVSGLFKVALVDLQGLFQGDKTEIEISGFKIEEDGRRSAAVISVNQESFVPHGDSYMKGIFKAVEDLFSKD